ncbi:hypothetical protein C0J52_22015 [Blattella germanica]|nr:hypothetical protein C0J52_22015 [Blattella germanica]
MCSNSGKKIISWVSIAIYGSNFLHFEAYSLLGVEELGLLSIHCSVCELGSTTE